MPDIKVFIMSLKLIWIRKISESTHKWRHIAATLFPFVDKLQNYGPSFPVKKAKGNPFWSHVFAAYEEFCNKVQFSTSAEILAKSIFYN